MRSTKASAKQPKPSRVPPRYAAAKIVLLGDAGVGKTALGWSLIGRDFGTHPINHPRQLWPLPALSRNLRDGTQCEAVLWDMASHPDFRLINPLSTSDASLVLLVFDPTVRPDPLLPVTLWLNQIWQRPRDRRAAILVAARTDVGAPSLTTRELASFCAKHRISGGFVATSATRRTGLDTLIAKIKRVLQWEDLPRCAVGRHFALIKQLVQDSRRNARKSTLLVSRTHLLNRLSRAGADDVGLMDLVETLPLLERFGRLRTFETASGEARVLLAPELFDTLAGEFVDEARRDELSLGALEEARILTNDYRFKTLKGLTRPQQHFMVRATTRAFLEHSLSLRCLREEVGQKTLLVFPELVNLRRPMPLVTTETRDGASYLVTGDVEHLFPILVVSLSHTNNFRRAAHSHDHARYETTRGGICGFRQEAARDRELDFVLYFCVNVSESTRKLFQGLFESYLERPNVVFQRLDPVQCSNCHTILERSVVRSFVRDKKATTHCNECGHPIVLPRPPDRSVGRPRAHEDVARERSVSDLRREFEQAIFVVKAAMETRGVTSPSCFISYAWDYAEQQYWVRETLAVDLQRAGIDVVLDRWQERVGISIGRFIEQIRAVDKIIVIGTPLYLRKYENRSNPEGSVAAAEFDIITNRLLGTEEQKESVLPVLRAGDRRTSLPPLLEGRSCADCRVDEEYFGAVFVLITSLYGIEGSETRFAELRDKLEPRSRRGRAVRAVHLDDASVGRSKPAISSTGKAD
jgi:GTPase SAR1 family protein